MLNNTKYVMCCFALVAAMGVAASVAEGAEFIAYRLSETKQLHFDDSHKAQQHLAAVKNLGCEAKIHSHGGHTDVSYRSTRWQSMEVATDQLAHQWESWLKKSGFETLHGHAADQGSGHSAHESHDHTGHGHAGHHHAPGQVEKVAYRMEHWRTLPIEDQQQASEIIAMMKGLGCEVRSENHAGHSDVSVHCPQWKHIELDSHRSAMDWQDWLQKQGFVVKHDH